VSRSARSTVVAGLLLGFAACRAPAPGRVHGSVPADAGYVTLPRAVRLEAKGTHDCAAVALHAILAFHEHPEELAVLRRELAVPTVEGSFPQQVMQAARERGFRARPVDGSFLAIRREIDAGRPALLMIRVGAERNHFVVATGYQRVRREVVFAHESGGCWILGADELDAAWRPCGHLQITLAPDPGGALLAVARTREADGDHEGALEIYRSVLAVLPGDPRARLGAGNCLALTGDAAQARREYLAAYRAGSRDPALLNNLADVSLHLGRDVDRATGWAAAAVAAYRVRLEAATLDLQRAVAARQLAHALGTLGEARLGRDDLTGARRDFEESLALLGDKRPELRIRRLRQIAYCCERLGEEERAAALREQAAALSG
jgi:hypothetical protein